MAAGWLKLLGTVPWGEVIGTAPKLADGAKKLWSAVSKRPDGANAAGAPTAAAPVDATTTDGSAIAALQAQVAALQAATADLHGQMLASSELIKALADQNAQLVAGIDAVRRRCVRLAVAAAAIAVVAVAALGLTIAR